MTELFNLDKALSVTLDIFMLFIMIFGLLAVVWVSFQIIFDLDKMIENIRKMGKKDDDDK